MVLGRWVYKVIYVLLLCCLALWCHLSCFSLELLSLLFIEKDPDPCQSTSPSTQLQIAASWTRVESPLTHGRDLYLTQKHNKPKACNNRKGEKSQLNVYLDILSIIPPCHL